MSVFELINKFTNELQKNIFENLNKNEIENINEIRLRVNQGIEIIYSSKSIYLEKSKISKEEIERNFLSLCDYSIFAFEEEITQGFFTVYGGHRIGVCGKVLLNEERKIKKIINVSSLIIRVTREVKGVSDEIFKLCIPKKNILIISKPCCGKTTLARDLTRNFSNYGYRVTLVDERSEIAGSYNGIPQNDCGIRTDVLDNCPKSQGLNIAIRCTNPNIIILDEIGTSEDVEGVFKAFNSGVSILATAHSDDMKSFLQKENFARFVQAKAFDLYFVLNKVKEKYNIIAYDKDFEVIYEFC